MKTRSSENYSVLVILVNYSSDYLIPGEQSLAAFVRLQV